MKLIPDAKKAAKMWSVRLSLAAAVIAALQTTLPLWESVVSPTVFAFVSSALGVGAAVARVIKQDALDS